MALSTQSSSGYLTKLSTCKTSPKYSFRGKPNGYTPNTSPGPGAYGEYNGPQKTDKFRAGPSHGFGTSPRDKANASANPGPGAYEATAQPHTAWTGAPKGSGFTKAPRSPTQTHRELNPVPGPGSYNAGLDKMMGTNGPKYSTSPKAAERRPNGNPGPGAYTFDNESYVAASQKRPQSPKFGFALSPREVRKGEIQPGPGAYSASADLRGPRYSMPGRYQRRPAADSPGPGAYESNVTTFGY
mmetsp:Transcript_50261/g.106795  ORF Transcript_50261/g.106795 Transcript_50261/m.106795 type:complete len:242 (+) Transcript_50261:166-891(+)|eukprot:CAMPEP_0206464080 /NCGR_PEP_ID=MMETSP0324_2-20121206/26998_1 /ASSEMBLY_ACC=CAM_ASM_000836 /TAXON_ID=2866 /ORGANISM="Crypthecodinium cohnii, Strain Seligo" /LENGTH=241 /DNA_ID=CAMNT_0053936633 /DNA_START=166 /DNA_END=891 /DNA_ORIENTATION=+